MSRGAPGHCPRRAEQGGGAGRGREANSGPLVRSCVTLLASLASLVCGSQGMMINYELFEVGKEIAIASDQVGRPAHAHMRGLPDACCHAAALLRVWCRQYCATVTRCAWRVEPRSIQPLTRRLGHNGVCYLDVSGCRTSTAGARSIARQSSSPLRRRSTWVAAHGATLS